MMHGQKNITLFLAYSKVLFEHFLQRGTKWQNILDSWYPGLSPIP